MNIIAILTSSYYVKLRDSWEFVTHILAGGYLAYKIKKILSIENTDIHSTPVLL